MLYVVRTIIGILLSTLGTLSVGGSVFIIPISNGNLKDCIAVWVMTIILFGLAMVVAPWMF